MIELQSRQIYAKTAVSFVIFLVNCLYLDAICGLDLQIQQAVELLVSHPHETVLHDLFLQLFRPWKEPPIQRDGHPKARFLIIAPQPSMDSLGQKMAHLLFLINLVHAGEILRIPQLSYPELAELKLIINNGSYFPRGRCAPIGRCLT